MNHCENPWHWSAPSRAFQSCPECPALGAPEPGTGSDWASAKGPGKPLPPRTTRVRAWASIPSDEVPTDREYLRHLLHVENYQEVVVIVKRAAAGYHDGSLPEFGHFRPVYFDGMGNE